MSNLDFNDLPPLKVNIASFLLKTYEILENESLSDLISWNVEGTAFVVHDPLELCQKVLANYFKHKNYPSFLRQLNMYSFKKTRNKYGLSEFRHKWFRRGQKNMLQYIRRRNQEDSDLKIQTKDNNSELEVFKKDHNEMMQSVKELQTLQNQIQANFLNVTERQTQLNTQNHMLIEYINQIQRQFDSKFDQLISVIFNCAQNLKSKHNIIFDVKHQNFEKNQYSNWKLYNDKSLQQLYYPNTDYQKLYYQRQQPQQFPLNNYQLFNQNLFQRNLALPLPALTNDYTYISQQISTQSSAQSSPYYLPNSPTPTIPTDLRYLDQIKQNNNQDYNNNQQI